MNIDIKIRKVFKKKILNKKYVGNDLVSYVL